MVAKTEKAYAALVKAETMLAASLGSGRKGYKEGGQRLESASDMIVWAREMGWIR